MNHFKISAGCRGARSALPAVLLALAVLGLNACGGDGYAGGCGVDAYGNFIPCGNGAGVAGTVAAPVASPNTFQFQQALVNAATQVQNFTVSSVDAFGNSYSFNLASQPGPMTTFAGAPAASATIAQTMYENGVQIGSYQYTNFYSLPDYQLLGATGATPGSFELVSTSQAAPVTALVGAGFPSFTANLFRDASQTVLDGTLVENLALSADTASTALLCMNDSIQLTQNGIVDGLSAAPSSTCLRISPAGDLLGLVTTQVVNGMTLTFQ